MKQALLAAFVGLGAPAIAADAIVTDSPVVQSLVARVTGETPVALLSPGADPHHFHLRPSQMRELMQADWLIWIGPDFSPWLDQDTLMINQDIRDLRLGEADPHGWLDPQLATTWAKEIAGELGVHEVGADFSRLEAEMRESLDLLADLPLIVGHDAYDALAERFDLNIVGAIADGHAAAPGAAHLSELRKLVVEKRVACVVSDSHEIEDYVQIVAEDSNAKVIDLDLSGDGLEQGPEYYPALMRRVAQQLLGCL